MDILIDFDGTVVTHDYPKIGKDIPNCLNVLQQIVGAGHNIIIFTMRSGEELEEAVQWYKKNNIKVYGVNTNPTQKSWTSSPKAYGQLIIDDIGLGVPLVEGEHSRPYVDWFSVEDELIRKGII
jgi:hypothetical protein